MTIPNWYVITGGPSSGKSSVLDLIGKLGFLVIPEAARVLIDEEMAKGKAIKEIRGDEAAFQQRVLEMKLETESKLPTDKTVFLDRALPDSVAYFRVCGLDPGEVLRFCRKDRYRKVFLLTQLPFKQDGARTESPTTIASLNFYLKQTYEDLGYEVVSVPMFSSVAELSIAKRLLFILGHVFP